MTDKKIWTDEDELEFQIGDMNGIAFEDKPEIKQEIKIDSSDKPDFVTPAVPFYENIERKKK